MQNQYGAPAARTVPLWFVHVSFEGILPLVQAPGRDSLLPGQPHRPQRHLTVQCEQHQRWGCSGSVCQLSGQSARAHGLTLPLKW